MSGYDQHFKKISKKPSAKKAKAMHKSTTAEDYIKDMINAKDKGRSRTKGLGFISIAFMAIGLASAGLGVYYIEDVETFLNKIEISWLGLAEAQNNEKSAETKDQTKAEAASPAGKPAQPDCVVTKGFTQEELNHFNKLNERKEELDRRDAELTMLEEELHKQRKEIEERIAKLENLRGEVADVLKDRVEIDQKRVGTLVEFYSNMKPKQAAEIFSSLNEDLAVEVLGKMKKKNAAEILNLLDSGKARALSEKFTGYKKR